MTKVKSLYKGVVTPLQDCRLQTQKSKWLCKFHGHYGYLRPNHVKETCIPRNCFHLVDLEALSKEQRCIFLELLSGVGAK